MNFTGYESHGYFDEMIGEDGKPRAAARPLAKDIESLPEGELELRQKAAEQALIQAGITFNVYSDSQGMEKTLPFDLIPRIMGGTEWKRMDRGLKQRITALNQFIDDLYHDRRILQDGVVPREIIASSKGFREPCVGLNPPRGIWCHITGTDLVRHRDGQICLSGRRQRPPRSTNASTRPAQSVRTGRRSCHRWTGWAATNSACAGRTAAASWRSMASLVS